MMEKQYSVQFFQSFVTSMQQACQNFVTFGQLVELSGYLSLEIDGAKKERYVLSELIQTSGNVISESYCTKVSRNCNPGWKPQGPRTQNGSQIVNHVPARQAGTGIRVGQNPGYGAGRVGEGNPKNQQVNRMGHRQQIVRPGVNTKQLAMNRQRQTLQSSHFQQNQSGSRTQVGNGSQRPDLQKQMNPDMSNSDVQFIGGSHVANPSKTVQTVYAQTGNVIDKRYGQQNQVFRRVKSPVPVSGAPAASKNQNNVRAQTNIPSQRLPENQKRLDKDESMQDLKVVSQVRDPTEKESEVNIAGEFHPGAGHSRHVHNNSKGQGQENIVQKQVFQSQSQAKSVPKSQKLSCPVIPQTLAASEPLSLPQTAPQSLLANKTDVSTDVSAPKLHVIEIEDQNTVQNEPPQLAKVPPRTANSEMPAIPILVPEISARKSEFIEGASRRSPLANSNLKLPLAEVLLEDMKTVFPVQEDLQQNLNPPAPTESRKRSLHFEGLSRFSESTACSPQGPCVIEMNSQSSSTESSAFGTSSHLFQESVGKSSSPFQESTNDKASFSAVHTDSHETQEHTEPSVASQSQSSSAKRPRVSSKGQNYVHPASSATPTSETGQTKLMKSKGRKPKEKTATKGKRGRRKGSKPKKVDQGDMSSDEEIFDAEVAPANRTLRSSGSSARRVYTENEEYLSDGLTEFLLKDAENKETEQ